MKQTAVEFLEQQIRYYISNDDRLYDMFKQALEMEKEQKGYSKEEVDNLLYKLLENNMCSHAGDELIEQFKKN